MSRTLIQDLDALHATYVVAVNEAIEADDLTRAEALALAYEDDAIQLMAEREGRQDLLPLIGLDVEGGRVRVERDTPLRRLVKRVTALRAA